MLELLEHHGAAAIGEHEAVTLQVPGTACLLRRIVAGGQRLRLAEPAEATGRRRHLTAAGQHPVGIAVLNGAHP